MHDRSNLENRLESNPFLANIAFFVLFSTVSHLANRFDIRLVEAILVGINNNLVRVQCEDQKRLLSCLFRLVVLGVLSILNEFENELGLLFIQIFRETGPCQ